MGANEKPATAIAAGAKASGHKAKRKRIGCPCVRGGRAPPPDANSRRDQHTAENARTSKCESRGPLRPVFFRVVAELKPPRGPRGVDACVLIFGHQRRRRSIPMPASASTPAAPGVGRY